MYFYLTRKEKPQYELYRVSLLIAAKLIKKISISNIIILILKQQQQH